MQKQPPNNNNPANPLLKVAALNIDKDYELSNVKQAKVKIRLVFKRSDDLRGFTRAKDGRPITVIFGLALKRASLNLRFSTVDGATPNGFVRIKKVAFVGPLAVKDHFRDKLHITKEASKHVGGTLTALVGLAQTNAMATAKAGVKGEIKSGKAEKKDRRVSRRFEKTNVTATYGGCDVHWEINPSETDDIKGSNYLEGDVFLSPKSGASIDACVFSRHDSGPISTVMVTGSVFVNMENLLIYDVSFLDYDGMSVSVSQLAQETTYSNAISAKIFSEETKKRLLKQIIRKHLITQGMTTEGGLVEICRGNT